MTQLQLLQMHLAAMFCTDERGRLLTVNEPWDQSRPAPLLFLGTTLSGELLWSVRADLPEAAVNAVRRLAESGETEPEAYGKLLHTDVTAQEICFRPPEPLPARSVLESCREVTGENCRFLNLGEFHWLAEELPAASPCFAWFADGKAVSVCRSVRIAGAHEAGVETEAAFRGRGYARIVVEAWANEVARRGGVPLYSALKMNLPSLRLAEKTGFQPFAFGCSIG